MKRQRVKDNSKLIDEKYITYDDLGTYRRNPVPSSSGADRCRLNLLQFWGPARNLASRLPIADCRLRFGPRYPVVVEQSVKASRVVLLTQTAPNGTSLLTLPLLGNRRQRRQARSR